MQDAAVVGELDGFGVALRYEGASRGQRLVLKRAAPDRPVHVIQHNEVLALMRPTS